MIASDTESSSWGSFCEEGDLTWMDYEGDEASKALLPLISWDAEFVWSDEDGPYFPYLAPWEALITALLFHGTRSSGTQRKDVALAVSVAKKLKVPRSLRLQNPVAAAGRSTWVYEQVYVPSLSIGPDVAILDYHQRRFSKKSPYTSSTHNTLPSRAELRRNWCDALTEAVECGHTDIFLIAATLCVGSGLLETNPPAAASRKSLLKLMAADYYYESYFSALPLTYLIDHQNKTASLQAVSRRPKLFNQAVELFIAAGADFGPEAGALLQVFPTLNKLNRRFFDTLVSHYRPADEEDFFDTLYHIVSKSAADATFLLNSLKKQRFVITDHGKWGEFLKRRLEYEEGSECLAWTRILVDQCPPLGFDLEAAVRNLIDRKLKDEHLHVVDPSGFRYVFIDCLGVDRLQQMQTPAELVQWLSPKACLEAAVESGYQLPDPRSPACAELAKASMRVLSKGSQSKVLEVVPSVLRLSQVELDKEGLTACLSILCDALVPNSRGDQARFAGECLDYFIKKGTLTNDFRFPNGDGLQHRIGIARGLSRVLQNQLKLDYSEVNPITGKFPLAIALEKEDIDSVTQMLRERLLPAKEVILKYRYESHTVLSLLFRWKRVFSDRVKDLPRWFAKIVGIDVVQELAKVKVLVRKRVGERDEPIWVLPIQLGSSNWPREEVKYFIEELRVEGSDDEEVLRSYREDDWKKRRF